MKKDGQENLVYVVESMNYGECEGVAGVFTEIELAEDFVKQAKREEPHNNFPITPMVLNAPEIDQEVIGFMLNLTNAMNKKK